MKNNKYVINKFEYFIYDKIYNYDIDITNIMHKLIYIKFKLKHIFCDVKYYQQHDDDIYLIVAYNKNNIVVDYLYFDFDFTQFPIDYYIFDCYDELKNEIYEIEFNGDFNNFIKKCFYEWVV